MSEFGPLPSPANGHRWYHEMNRYHWWILFVSALGWLFDTMDQTLFRISRQPAMAELLGLEPSDPAVTYYGGISMSIFMIGWATGGLIFGILGDKWGRARTMLLTIVLYSIFTGLSAFSTNWIDYSFYRFLTGLGVGGEFAAGVALVSEALPERARPFALGLLQALSAVGNIMGGFLCRWLLPMTKIVTVPAFLSTSGQPFEWTLTGWRLAMLAGVLPAILVIMVRRRLKDPESWKEARARADRGEANAELGSLKDLFSDPRWRRHAFIGSTLALAGIIGVWGVGFWTPDLVRNICRAHDLPKEQVQQYASVQSVLQDVGAFFGMLAYTWMATSMGRKAAFAISFILAYGAAMFVFATMSSPDQIYWMAPLLGFCMMTVFGGYAIYFPELFPTRLRSTGTAFCYNVARYVAAIGPFTLGYLSTAFSDVLKRTADGPEGVARANDMGFRYAAMAVLSVYFIGMITLYFAPETKGKPLPREDHESVNAEPAPSPK